MASLRRPRHIEFRSPLRSYPDADGVESGYDEGRVIEAAVSILFLGLAYAMILYIISVGLSVTMGLMGFVNLAHGAFAMAGGYVTVTLMNRYGVPFGIALLLACVSVALLSVVLERTLYARLYGAGELEQVLFTIGLVFMAVAVVRKIWGSLPQPITLPAALSGQIDLGFRSFPTYRSFLIAFSLTLILLLWLGVERTNFGARLRAAVDNRRMAESLGINTSQLFTLSFALGSGLAALGGGLGADILAIYPGLCDGISGVFPDGGRGRRTWFDPRAVCRCAAAGHRRYGVQIPGAATWRILHLSRDDRAAAMAAGRVVRAGLNDA